MDAPRQSGTRLPDARVAVAVVLAYSVSLFFVDGWLGMAAFGILAVCGLVAFRVRFMQVVKAMVPLLFILAFTVVAHIPQGVDEGLFYALRILLLAVAALAVAFSYDDSQFVRAFSSFGKPLRALRVPVDDIATMFSIALRFIPAGMDEFKRVADAQRSRGARLDEGGVVERMRLWGNVMIPMLVGLFRRAGVLSQAMEARCYGGRSARTNLHGSDRLGAPCIGAAALACLSVIVLGVVL